MAPKVVGYAAAVVTAYLAGIGFVFLFVPTPSLVDLVSACKIVSLLALIYANREIPENIEMERHADIHWANFTIVLCSMLVLLMMVVKVVVDDYAITTLAPAGRDILQWFDANAYWVSTAPVFAYCALDLYIAFIRRGCPQDHEVAMEFVVFRDLVCAAPLALVLALSELYVAASPLEDAAFHATFFFSGALAVILLASAIATKALNLTQSARRLARAEAGEQPPRPRLAYEAR